MTALVLFFLLIQVYAEDTFDCTDHEDDSYHPMYDTDNCRHYWHCIYVDTVYMRAVKRVCPAGTEFDIGLRECEISSLVNCVPLKSPHIPRTSTSTKAWKWKHSKLFSQKRWKPTVPFSITTKKHRLVYLEKSADTDVTTQQIKVLPFTSSQLTTVFSLEQLFKSLSAILSQYRSNKQQSAEYFIESEVYNTTVQTIHSNFISTAIQSTTNTPSSISQMPTFKQRQINRRRRNNITLYILTNNEHKIRQFSINQTRGILISCNEIRRRQLRDLIFRNRTTTHSLRIQNSASKIFPYSILFIISFLCLQK